MKEIKDSMEKEKESKIKNDLRINLMKYLRENNKIDIPALWFTGKHMQCKKIG
ncbi:MAG: hypothetical protein Ct9H300mP6_11250 [Gammaproteobacteria bacterium]|nr:MAG: hypothetical protein Ct9H300mP6_11250 [Gammaproteobacteria bacterium]